MPLILETAPVNDPVTLEEVKEHIHVDFYDEDARIADFIKAATQRLDGRDGSLGRCLVTQTWNLTLDRFTSEIAIPLPPCQSIDAITYVDPDGVTQTLAPTEYQAFALGTVEGAKLRPAYGKSWPTIRNVPEAVTITFTAGFGDDPEDIPEPIRTAIKMRVGHLFEHRESVVIGSGFITETPDGVEDFVRDHKTWSF
ncbi:head-tail connector protein [Zavarzinia compransoris]|uniref:Phage gp6-like head-tail connector protein n=1 Tax=Zavarzinia compransoris TaxID=1264899 RepID=A0A317DY51_9PROT|nr:phage head-tail connector protein [Zavarzinia compransoris]PWR18786.1 hypothetical protein DKG75_17540 [Zavarzinia compransoris]TDP48771.1 putative phiE125 gp8 family phage protein [Zavarzinia compransoris]